MSRQGLSAATSDRLRTLEAAGCRVTIEEAGGTASCRIDAAGGDPLATSRGATAEDAARQALDIVEEGSRGSFPASDPTELGGPGL